MTHLQSTSIPSSPETLWDVDPDDRGDAFALPLEHAHVWGVSPAPTAHRDWVAHGGDPRFYPYSLEEYGRLERWWIADLSAQPTATLEDELAHVTRQLVDQSLVTDDVLRLIGAAYDKPILEARAQWLAWEIKRRNALPDPPLRGWSIPADFIQRLKTSMDLPGFLMGRFGVELRQKGRDWWGCCPFHAEDTPSFVVHTATPSWHCFGACQQSGDVFDWLLASGEVRTWRAAIEYVADYLHVAMPKPPEPAKQARNGAPGVSAEQNTAKHPAETLRRGADLGIPSL